MKPIQWRSNGSLLPIFGTTAPLVSEQVHFHRVAGTCPAATVLLLLLLAQCCLVPREGGKGKSSGDFLCSSNPYKFLFLLLGVGKKARGRLLLRSFCSHLVCILGFRLP